MKHPNEVEFSFPLVIGLGVFMYWGWFVLFFLCSAITAAIRGVDVHEYAAVIPGLIASSIIVIGTVTTVMVIKFRETK